MNTQTNRTAVIYANENNIWDNQSHKFHYVRNGNVDESSYEMPYEEAMEVFKRLSESGEYDENMYLSETTLDIED